jgi:hypothetical protein
MSGDDYQQPAFRTQRLDVFRARFCREYDEWPQRAWDVYLAYERKPNGYEYHAAVECATFADDTEVVWIENRNAMHRSGMALELLNGLAVHLRRCCTPNNAIRVASERLFTKHTAWWEVHEAEQARG